MWWPLALSIFMLVSTGHGQNLATKICPMDMVYTDIGTNANAIIGGLYEMRQPGTKGFGCGPVITEQLQVLEASRIMISRLNRANYVPGITFGMKVYDTCREKSVTLKALQELYPQTTSGNLFCSQNNDFILGSVGPFFSSAAVVAAEFASSVPTSLISPRAATPLLSDKTMFPTFLRTVPSLSALSQAIVELLKTLKWEDNILLIYSDDEYGRSGYKQLLQAAYNRGVCFAKAIPVNPIHLTTESAKAALDELGGKSYNAGVMMMSFIEGKKTFEAIDGIPSLYSTQWIVSDFDITSNYNGLVRSRGAMLVTPSSPTLDDFKTFFLERFDINSADYSENPWFISWYEKKYSCLIRSSSNSVPQCTPLNQTSLEREFMQNPFVVPTMKAIAAYAEAVRLECTSSSVSCVNHLKTVSPSHFYDTLKNLNVTFPDTYPVLGLRGESIKFDANGDLELSDYVVYNHIEKSNSASLYEKIGEFKNNRLILSKLPTLYNNLRTTSIASNPDFLCPVPNGCTNCLKPQVSTIFRYSPGDVVIASLANGHKTGRFPFICGEGDLARLAALVAAEWAASRYNANSSKLLQVSLGSLVVDICPDALVTGGFITDLLSGNNRRRGASNIRVDNIYGFVDHTDGDQASMISSVLAQLKIPEVQTESVRKMGDGGSMSMMMSGDHTYTVDAMPNDHMLHEAIASVMLRLGWKYVQVVTHGTGMYNAAALDFKMTAGRHGICVVDMVDNLDSADSNRFSTAVERLKSRSDAPVVVVIAEMAAVRGLLQAIQNQGQSSQLQLVAGTEAWERSLGLNTGALTVGLEMSKGKIFKEFESWLGSLKSTQIVDNPFLSELFEMVMECNLGPSTKGKYTRVCEPTETFNTKNLTGMDKIPYVIQSVYTVADQLHEVIKEKCGDNYSGLCTSFRSSGDIGARLYDKLRNYAKLLNGYGINSGKSITDFVFYQQDNEFARYNNEDRQLVFNRNVLSNVAGGTSCASSCMECQYLFALQSGMYMPGDWLLAGIFSVSNPGPQQHQPYVCGDIRTSNGPQYTTAMMYALQQVNMRNAPVSVKGVTFGGIILDHCNNPGRANLLTSSIYSNELFSMGADEGRILSWLTDNSGATKEAEALLDPLGVAVVSPSATSMDLMDYSNFYRTIQGDSTVALALVKSIKLLGYSYFQVIYSDSAYGEGGLNILQDVAQVEGICIINSVKVSSIENADADNIVKALVDSETDVVVFFTGTAHTRAVFEAISRNNEARNSLFVLLAEPYQSIVSSVAPRMKHKIMSLRLQTGLLQNYNTYLNTTFANPYFDQYYMKLKQCNLPGFSTYDQPCPGGRIAITDEKGYAPDNFILATINAVYANVDALDRTIRGYCGDSYTQPCHAFLSAPDMRTRFNLNLANVDFVDEAGKSFRFVDREGNVIFDILQSDSEGNYRKVGTYGGVSLNLDGADTSVYSGVVSACSPPCLSCVMRGLNFSHIPGDIYLAGVFDVHKISSTPFTCGSINTLHGFLLLEAFHYALSQVNSKKGQFANILPDVKLGGIGIDACDSEIRGSYLVSNINNGMTTLARDGIVIDPAKIDAYIGSYGSRASIYLARVLTDLKIPQISYAAGNPDLSDDRYYPYFYRTVPSDKDMVEAILKFLDTKDIRYVQVVYEDTFNAAATKDYFIEQASSYRICVAQVVAYADIRTVTDETATSVVSQLIENPAANTVITLLSTELIAPMLRAVERSTRARGKLRFFGSDEWADIQEAVVGTAGQQAVNSLTVGLDSNSVEEFESYINARGLANAGENPWFEEYYQAIHNCYLSKVNTMGYRQACSQTLSDITFSSRYQEDRGVAYVIDAVYAAAFGLHETLKEKCGNNYKTVCQTYLNDKNRHDILNEKLKDVTFTDPLGANFQFVNRSGNYNYRYYALDRGVFGDPIYNEIGKYNIVTQEISISTLYENQINSNCERKDTCSECPLIRDNSLRHVTYNGASAVGSNTKTVVAFFDIHRQGVDPYRCGAINPEGFQQFLAFFYTLKKVVSSTNIRMVAIDTCSNSLRVDQDLYGILAGDGLCNSKFDLTYPLSLNDLGSVITLGELNTMAAARVLEGAGVTYMSPNALNPMLDNHPHLIRSIAPTSAMMKALADLLKALDLTYVDVVYENTMEGYQMMKKFDHYTYDAQVCLASQLAVDEDASDLEVSSLLNGLNRASGSRAVVLLGSHMFVKRILEAASRQGIADDYLWVLAGPWEPTNANIELLGIGSNIKVMSIRRRTWQVQDFYQLVNGLAYDDVHDGASQANVPTQWFDEFFQLVFDCTLPDSERPLGGGKPLCNKKKTFNDVEWMADPYVVNTVVATYTVAMALNKDSVDMNKRMELQNEILSTIWTMSDLFSTLPADQAMKFDTMNRWWDQGFIFSTHWSSSGSSAGQDFQNPINFTHLSGILGDFSVSKCSEGTCGCLFAERREAAVMDEMYSPSDHRNFYKYDSSGEKSFRWPIWTIPVAVVTCLGLIITLILFLVLICAYPVRGGTSVLGYMSIIGIFCIYVINFAFFLHASEAVCGIRRFLMGVVYMIALGPMLVKAMDNWRYSHVDQAEGRYSGISSACSLLMVSVGLVLIQCIIPIMWLILRHPTATELMVEGQQSRHDNWWCDPAQDYDLGLVLSFAFVLFVIIITAGFSALAFNSSRNNSEARWILFSCAATGGCFLVWMVVTTNAGPPYRDPAVAIANVVNATLLMMTMPLRKALLMMKVKMHKDDKDNVYHNNGSPYVYGSNYNNPTYEIGYYDNTFMDDKLEEF